MESTTLEDRRRFATKFFQCSFTFTIRIFNYFNKNHEEAAFKLSKTTGKCCVG